jgi:glyceraldehyde 3-phosphate dehydrogenase
MTVKIAINGFGRIGRLVARAILERGDDNMELVAINDLADVQANALLFKYDSTHGRFAGEVVAGDDHIMVDGKKIAVTSERNPGDLPHKAMGIDIVFECTGFFQSKEACLPHLAAGAKRVLISAPAGGVDKTVVYGVNHDVLTSDDIVVSNASCTTNCLAPVAKVLHELVGIERGFMTTIHSCTATCAVHAVVRST